MAAKAYPRWALAMYIAAVAIVAVSFAFVLREAVVRSRKTVEETPKSKPRISRPTAFNPFPADLRGPIPAAPPAETDYAKLVEMEEGLKALEYPSAYFLYDSLTKAVPEALSKTGAPPPSSVRQLAAAGFIPFEPPDSAIDAIDSVLAARGWSGEATGRAGGSPVTDWSDAEKTMYLRAIIGSAAMDAVSAGARGSGALGEADGGGADGLIALSAPGFAARAEVWEKWFGKSNPAFWVNPYTGSEMKNVPPDESEDAKKGNFFAEMLPDGSVRLRFYIR